MVFVIAVMMLTKEQVIQMFLGLEGGSGGDEPEDPTSMAAIK